MNCQRLLKFPKRTHDRVALMLTIYPYWVRWMLALCWTVCLFLSLIGLILVFELSPSYHYIAAIVTFLHWVLYDSAIIKSKEFDVMPK